MIKAKLKKLVEQTFFLNVDESLQNKFTKFYICIIFRFDMIDQQSWLIFMKIDNFRLKSFQMITYHVEQCMIHL